MNAMVNTAGLAGSSVTKMKAKADGSKEAASLKSSGRENPFRKPARSGFPFSVLAPVNTENGNNPEYKNGGYIS